MPLPDPTSRIASDHDLERLVASFEDLTLPREIWQHHRTHLIVCLGILRSDTLESATTRIREGIQRFNLHHGVEVTPDGGYHDTLTRGFIRLIWKYLQDHSTVELPVLLDGVVERLGDKRLLLRYYSRDRIMSWEARIGWVEPDLEPLP